MQLADSVSVPVYGNTDYDTDIDPGNHSAVGMFASESGPSITRRMGNSRQPLASSPVGDGRVDLAEESGDALTEAELEAELEQGKEAWDSKVQTLLGDDFDLEEDVGADPKDAHEDALFDADQEDAHEHTLFDAGREDGEQALRNVHTTLPRMNAQHFFSRCPSHVHVAFRF